MFASCLHQISLGIPFFFLLFIFIIQASYQAVDTRIHEQLHLQLLAYDLFFPPPTQNTILPFIKKKHLQILILLKLKSTCKAKTIIPLSLLQYVNITQVIRAIKKSIKYLSYKSGLVLIKFMKLFIFILYRYRILRKFQSFNFFRF